MLVFVKRTKVATFCFIAQWEFLPQTNFLHVTLLLSIKASEMLVAPPISECFGLPWSALVCYSLPWSVVVCLGCCWFSCCWLGPPAMQDWQDGQKGQEGPLDFSFAPFGRSGRYVCLHPPASPCFFIFFVCSFLFRCYCLFCLFV